MILLLEYMSGNKKFSKQTLARPSVILFLGLKLYPESASFNTNPSIQPISFSLSPIFSSHHLLEILDQKLPQRPSIHCYCQNVLPNLACQGR